MQGGHLLQVRPLPSLCAPSAAVTALFGSSGGPRSPRSPPQTPQFCLFNRCRRRRRSSAPPAAATLLQSAARRRALVLTLALLTACYTWSSVRRLSELTQVESELPAGAAGGGLLQRAEANIASHLHGAASEQALN